MSLSSKDAHNMMRRAGLSYVRLSNRWKIGADTVSKNLKQDPVPQKWADALLTACYWHRLDDVVERYNTITLELEDSLQQQRVRLGLKTDSMLRELHILLDGISDDLVGRSLRDRMTLVDEYAKRNELLQEKERELRVRETLVSRQEQLCRHTTED